MVLRILKKVIIFAVILKVSECQSDSQPSDATSRIRFIQFQPSNGKKQIESNTESITTADQEWRQSNIFGKTAEGSATDHLESLVPKNFAFAYAIKDRKSGDDFSHTQAHDGKATKGQYRVKLPDGRVQVVTYLADNGGYRADIRYDQGKNAIAGIQEEAEADNSASYNVYSNERFSASTINENDLAIRPKTHSENNDPALLYYNEFRNFGVSTTRKPPASSYETVEHIDEEQFPYDRKLIDDVNYLLRFVTPTIETQTENVFDITADKIYKPLHKVPRIEDNNRNNNNPFSLPADFPYKSSPLKNKNHRPLKFSLSLPISAPPYETSEKNLLSSTHKYDPPQNQLHTKPLFLPNVKNKEHLYGSTPRNEPPDQYRLVNGHEFSPPPTLSYEALSQLKFKNPVSSTPKYEATSQPKSTPTLSSGEFLNILTETRPLQPQNYDHISSSERKVNEEYTSSTPHYHPTAPTLFSTPESPKLQPASLIYRNEESVFKTPKPAQIFKPSQPYIPRHQVYAQPLSPISRNEQADHNPYQINSTSYSKPNIPKYQQLEVMHYERPYNPNFSSESHSSEIHSPHLKENSQELPPVAPVDSFDSREHPPVEVGPSYDSEELPPVLPVDSRYKSQDYNPITPTVNQFRPILLPTDSQRTTPQFGNIEIPQYLHIHRYESGEDAKPKELIYYTPLQIQVPNSVAYIEHGNPNVSNHKPSYVTLTEHTQNSHTPQSILQQHVQYQNPPETHYFEPSVNLSNTNSLPQTEFPNPGNIKFPLFQTIDNSKYVSSTPSLKEPDYLHGSPLNGNPSNSAMETSAEEYENNSQLNNLPQYFDPRKYSGYFDFLSSSEMDEEKQMEDNQSVQEDDSRPRNNPLPQYVYNYATATPSHRYISSEVSSHEINSSEDPIRNSTFRSSAYLRPLHKERVYIHHNSQPSTSTPDDHYNSFASTTRPIHRSADFSIVKSISSTIPPELLKDFDDQLSSSILRDSSDEATETKAQIRSPVITTVKPKLSKIIVKKLQSALSTNGKLYLKTPS